MNRRSLLPLALVSILGLSACGSDDESAGDTTESVDETTADTASAETTATDESTASTDPAGSVPAVGGDVCEPITVIADLNSQSEELMGSMTEWAEVKDFLASTSDEVLSAYDRLAAAEPSLAEDAAVLRSLTEDSVEAATTSDDIGDFTTALLDNPTVMQAAQAGIRLDAFAEENCGVSTGGPGI